ncbi:MAG: Asp23/Gls24 family envelope stress response protein [Solobacterium sp.]|nr:Asp23/Gls24 family envelope stress response protein [Solobacterium sp.]
MTVEKTTNYGNISVSEEAVAALAGGIITECYGVVGMSSRQVLRDGWAELLKKENYARGVVVRKTESGLEIDLYIIVSFGVRISEVVQEAQKKIKYILQKTLSVEITKVNVFVQGVRVVA